MSISLASSFATSVKTFNLARAAGCVAVASCVTGVFAQPSSGEGPPSTSLSLGVGVISMQKPYTGIDRETKVLPVLQFENKYVHIFGPQIGIKIPSLELSDTQQLNFSIVGKYDGSGYKAKDAPILFGMSERKGGFWAGAEVEWKNDWVDVKAGWLADVSGKSKGQKLSLGAEKTWHFGERVMFTPRVEATWQDKKYVNYYYGVRDSEATASRAAYTAKAGTSVEVGVRGVYLFDQRHSVFLDVAASSLAKSVKDSPLVDRSSENRVLLGYTYRFR